MPQPRIADAAPISRRFASPAWPPPGSTRLPSVYVFNPYAEGHIAYGKSFAPVKHQVGLAEDLANLPRFLAQPGDLVLTAHPPLAEHLEYLEKSGFPTPEFVPLEGGRLEGVAGLQHRRLGALRPWAWGPDSVTLLEPLFGQVAGEARAAAHYFNAAIGSLYSKAWSTNFLRQALTRHPGGGKPASSSAGGGGAATAEAAPWLCSEREVGVAVDRLEDALEAVAAIRRCGHHRVVVKEAYGLAGQNAIRLWEPELLPTQRRWLTHTLEQGRTLVVEPWLERELDFSVQLEMAPEGLALLGFTGLINDRKGQFLANWAEPDRRRCLPRQVTALFPGLAGIAEQIQELYAELIARLEIELRGVGFLGPVSIDALVYRTPEGDCRLKPVVEINPRYTMGRLTLELMRRAAPESYGQFRLVTRARARTEGFADFPSYARALGEGGQEAPLETPAPRPLGFCLNDPRLAQVCLATFTVHQDARRAGSLLPSLCTG